jgi:hypothetical protein
LDAGVVMCPSFERRELQDVADGRPLKEWTMPDEFRYY